MTTIDVTARKWAKGWELELDEQSFTQVSKLTHAEDQVRDYLDTISPDISHSDWKINIVLEDPALARAVNDMKTTARAAAELQIEAGKKSRAVVRELRSKGLSPSEVAVTLNITRGRVSQLEHGREKAASRQ